MANLASRRLVTPAAALSESSPLSLVEPRIIVLIIAHVPLALLMDGNPAVSTLHALAMLAVGVWVAVTGKNSLQRAACVCMYILGAEVLWRMTKASVFWEYGKYAVAVIMFLALLRTRSTRIPILPLLFFLFLLPSVLITVMSEDLPTARADISFNLSGHLALFVSIWFFSYVRFTKLELRQALFALIIPITGVAAITGYTLLTAPKLLFTSESSFQASGGFGPNQVSLCLGLGAIAAWYILLYLNRNVFMSVLLIALVGWYLVQGVLTFSRGGVAVAVIAIILMTLPSMSSRRQQVLGVIYAVVAVLLALIIVPQLDSLTQGMLGARYESGELSHRDEVVAADIQLFLDHPITGIGVGLGTKERADTVGFDVAAHTEYTRLLSEHGLMGVLALLVLLAMSIQQIWRNRRDAVTFSIATAALVFAMLSMGHAAMRVAAISVMFGLAFATFDFGSSRRAITDKIQRISH